MGLKDWMNATIAASRASGDADRIGMVDLYYRAWSVVHVDPSQGLQLMTEARTKAERAGERWWMVLCDHWRGQFLLHHLRDFNQAQEVVVAAIVEVRKPEYQQFPQRVCLHEDMICAYIGIDPLGYQIQIDAALDYMQQQVAPGIECYICQHEQRATAALEMGRIDEAHAAALRYLAVSQKDDHHNGLAHRMLCRVAFQRQDWSGMVHWAADGEVIAQRKKEPLVRGELLMWQALATIAIGKRGVLHTIAAFVAGDRRVARRLYDAAMTQIGQTQRVPETWFFAAQAAFHEQLGELERALTIWEQGVAMLAGRGAWAAEARCHLEYCRLRKLLGLPRADAVANARASLGHLRHPEPLLSQLATFE